MVDFIQSCLDEIERIADGQGDDASKRSAAKAQIEAFIEKRPDLIDKLRIDLTIRTATSTMISMAAKHLLEEMREHAETQR